MRLILARNAGAFYMARTLTRKGAIDDSATSTEGSKSAAKALVRKAHGAECAETVVLAPPGSRAVLDAAPYQGKYGHTWEVYHFEDACNSDEIDQEGGEI